ncbi:endogenous retrovirus group K member 18 Pol protein-like protein [Turdus rufiventris]|nr:endogenous retrovirus group K member 18 Pol protein-like protein [Turdus rufiventris]
MAETRLWRKQLLSAEEAELFELAQAAGSGLDPEVFRVLLDLLRMNVAPLAVFQVLKSMCAGQRLPPGPEGGPAAAMPISADSRGDDPEKEGFESTEGTFQKDWRTDQIGDICCREESAVRNAVMKAKAETELHLVRDVKDKKKGFCKYPHTKGTHNPVVNELENLMMQDIGKVDTLNDSFALVFTSKKYLDKADTSTIKTIQKAGFEIPEDKVQCTSPRKYLGFQIRERTIVPQQLTIRDDPKPLRDVHILCGSINWIRHLLGITTEDLAPLSNLLHGNKDLDSPGTIIPEAREAITKVQDALSSRQAHRYELSLPFQFAILGKAPRFHGLIFQWDSQLTDPLLILEWVFTNNQPTKTITTFQEIMAHLIRKARTHLRSLVGCEFTYICMPLTTGDLEHLLQTNESLPFVLDSYRGQISIYLPKYKLFNQNAVFHLVPKLVQSRAALKALTVFTDGSGSSHKLVMTWKDPKTQKWESDVQRVEGSPQIAKMADVVRAFEKFCLCCWYSNEGRTRFHQRSFQSQIIPIDF